MNLKYKFLRLLGYKTFDEIIISMVWADGFFSIPGAGSFAGGTGPAGGSTASGYYGEGFPSAGAVTSNNNTKKVDFENQYADEAIDIEKYIKCFAAVPDAGAVCSIEIFSDIRWMLIPRNSLTGITDRPVIVLYSCRKKNGSQLVVQNICNYRIQMVRTLLSVAF